MKKIFMLLAMLIVFVGCNQNQPQLVLEGLESMEVGDTQILVVSGPTDIEFVSSDNTIATVNDLGEVIARKEGVVTIQVRMIDRPTIVAEITITISAKTEYLIESFIGTMLFVEETTVLQLRNQTTNELLDANFTTDQTEIIDIQNQTVFAIKAGIATVVATDAVSSDVLATITLVVLGPKTVTIMSNTEEPLYIGDHITLVAIYNEEEVLVRFVSSNSDIATVDGTTILLHEVGNVTIMAKHITEDIVLGEFELTILPERESIQIEGRRFIYVEDLWRYRAVNENGEEIANIIWSINNSELALLDQDGWLDALQKGTVVLRATLQSDPRIFAELEIEIDEYVDWIVIHGAKPMVVGEYLELSASVYPEYVSQDVTWSVSNLSVATIDDTGRLTGLQVGTIIVTATSVQDTRVTEKVTITIYPLPLTIEIVGNSELAIGSTTRLSAIILPENANQEVFWSTSDPSIATIDETGFVHALSPGIVTITAVSKSTSQVSASKNITVQEAADVLFLHTKILSLDTINYVMELQGITQTQFSPSISIRKLENGVVFDASIDDLTIGMTNVYAKVNITDNVIEQILIDGKEGFNFIRVGIRNSIGDISVDATLYHDLITLETTSPTLLQTFDEVDTIVVPSGRTVTVRILAGNISITSNSEVLLRTSKRVQFIPTQENSEIIVKSITRSLGNPRYGGQLEVSIVNNRLLLVNDVHLEEYLTKVVPSEMPASYHIEALKAQAIAARTYAYMDMYRKTHQAKGYTVDDSISSQVYNNVNRALATTNAVYATEGLVMMNNGVPIQAFYYSTSSGLTASGHEVWFTSTPVAPIPYLIGQNLSTDLSGNPIEVDTTSEDSMLAFFKRISFNHPDAWATFHRWRVTFTKDNIRTTLNAHLQSMHQNASQSFLTKVGDQWSSLPIPNDVGQVYNVMVSERGTSGVVMSLDIETESGTYRILNQYNIRFTLRPGSAGVPIFTSTSTGSYTARSGTILNSGFFAIETMNDEFVFYGGGNGHGVGMSQNGARGLGEQGYTFTQILSTYYSSTDFIDVRYDYTPLTNIAVWME